MSLERSAADLDQFCVAPKLLDPVLRAVAVAAEHLDRVVGHVLRGRRREELRGIGAETISASRTDGAGDVIDQRAHRFDLRVAVADVALDLAVLVERLAESFALAR